MKPRRSDEIAEDGRDDDQPVDLRREGGFAWRCRGTRLVRWRTRDGTGAVTPRPRSEHPVIGAPSSTRGWASRGGGWMWEENIRDGGRFFSLQPACDKIDAIARFFLSLLFLTITPRLHGGVTTPRSCAGHLAVCHRRISMRWSGALFIGEGALPWRIGLSGPISMQSSVGVRPSRSSPLRFARPSGLFGRINPLYPSRPVVGPVVHDGDIPILGIS